VVGGVEMVTVFKDITPSNDVGQIVREINLL
jgi:hypothetical protein